ncbi:sugar ABC transporter substrate-binding protein [Ktedonobacter sp. SOSP1-85]|uniref:ABC transporter substrate-binding protein n=1 Tax=Ktedonobacter sp. SOSP1-85 TaxID=2778367 RepID=UPI0019168040|nr:ABC transporter substrate-binding protein [Ktedonobacter sp. SOSP1-85]GHO79832.1 sugar ABC transporter substrate-binding protein [Ktedonobacter sp. SOSP1-85]
MNPQPFKVAGQAYITSQKRTSKRFFSLISMSCLIFLALGLLLSACGGSAQSSNGKIELTEMDYLGTEPANTEINKLIKQYEQEHPDVTIKRTAVPIGSFTTKVSQQVASHTLPDILVMDNPNLPTFASTGALTQLDSYLTGDLASSKFYGGSLSTMQYQGKTYAVSTGNNDLALYYNKKMFNDAGLKPPTTWAELQADAKALTKGNTYGFALSAPATEEGSWQFEPYLWSNGGDLDKVDGPAGVGALQFLTDMLKDGSLSKASLNWGQADVLTQFEEGHAAMMENGPWDLSLLKQAKVDYGVVALPAPSAGKKTVSPLGGEIWTIPQTDDTHQKAAWDFLNWLEQPKQITDYDQVQGYIPPLKAAAQDLLKQNTELQVFADELNNAQARTAKVGEKYPNISQQIWTAEQSALSGSLSPQSALTQAQQKIDAIVKG